MCKLNLNPTTPTVFVHSGASWFLPYALQQARHADPRSQIHLIGDQPAMEGVIAHSTSTYENEAIRRFREVFVPMSPNTPEFELMCYLRWFYLSEFLKHEGCNDVFYFDSDVLNFSTGDNVKATMLTSESECGLSVVAQPDDSCEWTACGHASYWKANILGEFCDFCIRTYTEDAYLSRYREKLAWHDLNGIRGGINDMTTLYLFWEQNKHRITNLSISRNGAVVDHNVAFTSNHKANEYVSANGMKKIEVRDEHAYFFKTGSNEPIQVHSIHFQGARKPMMPVYYTGPSFPGKRWSEFQRGVRKLPKKFRSWLKKQ